MTRAVRACGGEGDAETAPLAAAEGASLNEHLRDRILRRLESLSDERGYQVLDFVDFLESRFAERSSPQGNVFTRFTEAVEDRLRAGKVSASAIAETMSLLNRAVNVLNGAVAAGRSVASDLMSAAQTGPTRSPPPSGPTGSGTTTAQPPHAGESAARSAEPRSGPAAPDDTRASD